MNGMLRLLIGPPLPTQQLSEQRVSKFRALGALSPDALASIAYANQEIFLGLVVAGAVGLHLTWTIALLIAILLCIVVLSYTQVISAYPAGGGSYSVAYENLGRTAGLIAAAGLVVDYLLNVAVSMAAGVEAVISVIPGVSAYRVPLAILLLIVITLANLRGIREAGLLMAGPVYFFVGSYLVLIVVGLVRAVAEGPGTFSVTAVPASEALTAVLVLRAFSAGCTALTGVESISNGVPIFKAPESRNAIQAMIVMVVLMVALFLCTTGLTQYLAVLPQGQETILSALAQRVVGSGFFHVVIQLSALLVLMVAANTSFVGFPRLASILARDDFMPRQLALVGDRLVYSNGILLLASLAGFLIVVFGGDTHALIPLFAVGAFLAFTLSQAGMVVHWYRMRGAFWRLKALVNGVGMAATGTALLIIGVSKFAVGAWIIVILLPILVIMFQRIHTHYKSVAAQLSLGGLPPSLNPLPEPRIVLPISGVHRGVIHALRFARSLSANVTAVYIEIEPGQGERVRKRWEEWGLHHDASLIIEPSPYRSIVGPFLAFLDRTDHDHNDGQLATVLLPEFVPRHWWEFLLHNQTAWMLRLALLYRRRVFGKSRAIVDVPMHLRD